VETRFVPDAAGAWLVYDLGALVIALPQEFRAAIDAIAAAAVPHAGVPGVIAALQASGIAEGAPFAVIEATPAGLHLALRGPATVSVGAETLTGLGASEWVERIVPGAGVVRLTVPGGEWTLTPDGSRPARALTPVAFPVPSTSAPVTPMSPPAPLFHDSHDITAVPDLEASAPVPAVDAIDDDGATVLIGDRPDRSADDGTVVIDEIANLRNRRKTGLGVPQIPAVPRAVPRLTILLPDGSQEPLDPAVVIGRAPNATGDGAASRLVRLEGDGDISRNHARVAVEGGTPVVTDLGSRNGTIVRVPGRPAQKLRAGEPTPVLVGTVIDLGGGIELSIREG
jgi:hypothetical protein